MADREFKVLNLLEPINVVLTDATIDSEPTGQDKEDRASYSYYGNIPSFIIEKKNSVIFAEFTVTKSVDDQHSITIKATYGLGCNIIEEFESENKEILKDMAYQLVSACIWPQFSSFATCVSGFTLNPLPRLPVFPDIDYFQFGFIDEEIDQETLLEHKEDSIGPTKS